jgi:O-antigen/teichoic acid export membrane protein
MHMTESTLPATTPKSPATKVIQNTAVLMAGRIANAVLGGASSVLVVRYLGSERLGLFSAIYAYVSLFGWLATLGIEPVLTRESARWRDRAGSIMATGVALCSVFAIVAAAFVILLAPYAGFGGKMQLLVVFVTMELLLSSPLRLPGVIFQVDMKQWYGISISVGRQVVWLVTIIVLARAKGSLTAFVIGRLLVSVLETALIVLLSARFLRPPRQIHVENFTFYVRACIPIALSILLASIYLRIDQVMLHKLGFDKALGFYAAAVRVSELFELIPAALLSSVFPLLAIAANDTPRMTAHTDRIFRYVMATAGLLCTVIYAASGLIVQTLYGAQYAPSAQLLSILIWSELAVFFGTIVSNILLARALQNYLIYPTILGAVANVLLNLIWIPRYAALGSAWATLVSYTLAWTVGLLGFAKTRGIVLQGLRQGVTIAFVSIAAGVIASSAPWPPVWRIGSAAVLFGVGVGVIGAITAEDIRYVWTALSQTLSRSV